MGFYPPDLIGQTGSFRRKFEEPSMERKAIVERVAIHLHCFSCRASEPDDG